MSLSLKQLALALQLESRGDDEIVISGVASAESAGQGDLCFLTLKKYLPKIKASGCLAVIAPAEVVDQLAGKSVLISTNPQYHFARAMEALGLLPQDKRPAGVDSSARIAASACLGEAVDVGPLAVVADEVEIGDGSVIGAGAVIEHGARIGAECCIHSRVVIGPEVRIGNRCVVKGGAVIGADGFGLAMHDEAWYRIPQLGSVSIEDDVEIGANTTVDRGALDDTVIETGCKLDNLIQVAHNVRIGAHTAIAGCVGIAGSASIGRYCKISGGAGILGHLTIADHVTVTAMSLVTKDIEKPGVYSSGTPLMENSLWHRNNARYRSLDQLAQTVARLDKSQDKT